jgi:hypothetical protein
VARLERAFESRVEEEQKCQQTMGELTQRLSDLKVKDDGLNNEAQRISAAVQAVENFIDEHETVHTERQQRQSELETQIERLQSDKEAVLEEIEQARSAEQDAKASIRRYQTQADDWEKQLSSVEYRHPSGSTPWQRIETEFDWVKQTPEELKSRYDSAYAGYDALTRQYGVDGLKSALQAHQQHESGQKREYLRHSRDMDPTSIEAWLNIDHDAKHTELDERRDQARSDQGAIGERLKRLQKERKNTSNKRKHPAALLEPHLGVVNIDALKDNKATTESDRERLKLEIEDKNKRVEAITHQIATLDSNISHIKTLLKLIDQDRDIGVGEDAIDLPKDKQGLTQAHSDINQALGNAVKALDRINDQAAERYEAIRTHIGSEEARDLEPRLSTELSGNHYVAACQVAERLSNMISERRLACEHELDKLNENLQVVRERLRHMVDTALQTLGKAVRQAKVPDTITGPFAGKPILKWQFQGNRLPDEIRQQRIENYVDRLIADNRRPADGAELAAELVEEMAAAQRKNGQLGLQLIKPTDARLGYMAITERVGSGGESMTAALFLYLVLAQIRSHSKAQAQDLQADF